MKGREQDERLEFVRMHVSMPAMFPDCSSESSHQMAFVSVVHEFLQLSPPVSRALSRSVLACIPTRDGLA